MFCPTGLNEVQAQALCIRFSEIDIQVAQIRAQLFEASQCTTLKGASDFSNARSFSYIWKQILVVFTVSC